MKKRMLPIIVFVTGFLIMTLEIIGARILAPYLGTSLVVWTSLIGVVLGSLSLGYYLGGKFADKKPTFNILFNLLLAPGVLVLLSATVKEPFLYFVTNSIEDLRLASLFSTSILFGLPTIFMGMITPYALRLSLKSITKTGRISGNLYAISTLGSILGTFLAGFYLLPLFGNTKILFLISLSLILLPLLVVFEIKEKQSKLLIVLIVLFVWIYLFKNVSSFSLGFKDIDTKYNRIILSKYMHPDSGRQILSLQTDSSFTHSEMYLDNKEHVIKNYKAYYQLDDYFVPQIDRALALGGAGYSYPIEFLKTHDKAVMDVVEIDPEMTRIAKEYFNLKENDRLNIYHEDARSFINKKAQGKSGIYDTIYIDAFTSVFTVPYQLTTVEVVESMHNLLDDEGVIFLNLVSSFEGEGSKFIAAEYETYKSIFPQVYLFRVQEEENPHTRQNIILVALKSETKPSFTSQDEELNNYLSTLWEKPLMDIPILTDDFAPVDQYLLSLY